MAESPDPEQSKTAQHEQQTATGAPGQQSAARVPGVWELAWPTMAAMGAATLVRFTDFAMVGFLGASALAGVGLGGQVYWLIEAATMLVPTGLAAILARAVGARDQDLVDESFRQALLLGTAISVAATFVLLPFVEQAIQIYGVEPDVVTHGADYVWWRLWGTVPMALALVFAAGLRAAGDVRSPLVVGLAANAANIGLNWLLIYGHLGFPALGVAGSAIASSLAMALQLGLFAWLWLRDRLVLPFASAGIESSWRPDRALWTRLTRIGTPTALEQGFFQIGLLAFQRIMSFYGTPAIAAYNVGAQVLAFAFIPGVGFATAAATLVGQQLGAGEPDEAARAGWRSTLGAVLAMSAFGALLVATALPIAQIFSNDAEVVRLTVDFIWILGAAHPLIAIEFALGGALRGAGDTLFPMIAVFVGLLCVRLALAFALATAYGASLQLVWCALIADYGVKAAMLATRFQRGRWRERRV